MSGNCRYIKQKKQVSYDGGLNWSDTGDYRKGSFIDTDSPQCGYEVVYRWVNIDKTVDYYCQGTDKYYKQKKQVSYDGGTTYSDVSPAEYRQGGIAERNSADCGYSPTDYSTQYLTYIIDSSIFSTFDFDSHFNGDIQYSVNNGEWLTLHPNERLSLAIGDKVSFKASLTPTSGSGIGHFCPGYGSFTIQGNIMSLLFGDNFIGQTDLTGYDYAFNHFMSCVQANKYDINIENLILPATTLAPYCYAYMFESEITTPIKILPATTLAEGCYQGMFSNCQKITELPVISATTLAPHCYERMFENCKKLSSVPSNYLPVTTLTESCYEEMFYKCYNLKTPPQLPATSLAERCYYAMFQDCTALSTAPVLSATTLAERCYMGMFLNCTSLTKAPDLPATTLADFCYRQMFQGCFGINYIKCLAVDIPSMLNCLYNWTKGVSATGTFVKNSAMSDWPSGDSGIPSGWTVQDA